MRGDFAEPLGGPAVSMHNYPLAEMSLNHHSLPQVISSSELSHNL